MKKGLLIVFSLATLALVAVPGCIPGAKSSCSSCELCSRGSGGGCVKHKPAKAKKTMKKKNNGGMGSAVRKKM